MRNWQQNHEEILNRINNFDKVASSLIGNSIRNLNSQFFIGNLINERTSELSRVIADLPRLNLPDLWLKQFKSINQLTSEYSSISQRKDITSLSKNFFAIQKLLSERQELITSSFGTAVLALSLKQHEIQSLAQSATLSLEKIAALNLPHSFDVNLLKSLGQSKVLEQIDGLRDSFIGNLAFAFREAIESSENEEEAFAKVESIIEEKIADSSKSSFTTQNTLALALTALGILIALYSNLNNSTTNVSSASSAQKSAEIQSIRFERLLQLTEEIVKNTKHNSGTTDENIYYVAQREFKVKANPDFKSSNVGILFPNTKVKLIAAKHKWVYVEWTDYLEAIPRYGWVNKKYLKKIEK